MMNKQAGAVQFIVLIVLLLGIAGAIYLVTSGNPLKLFSKATQQPPIVFTKLDGSALSKVDDVTIYPGIATGEVSTSVRVELTSTLGPAVGSKVSSPISGPSSRKTRSYKVVEDPSEFANARSEVYTSDPVVFPRLFKTNLQSCGSDQKSLWAEFEADDGTKDRVSAAIKFENTCSFSSYQRAFITSVAYNGNLGGLYGADVKCQERAAAANLTGTWKAWLSDSNTSASSRLIHHSNPYKLLDGTVVANNWDDLTDASIQNMLNVTELGKATTGQVWTNTNTDGSSASTDTAFTCGDWTSSTKITKGNVTTDAQSTWGYDMLTDSLWTNNGMANALSCGAPLRLYCFEQTTITGDRPLVTSAPAVGGGGGGSGGGGGGWGTGGNTVKQTPVPMYSAAPKVVISQFRIAENPTELQSATWRSYTTDAVSHTFSDPKPGIKSIFVQFGDDKGNIIKVGGEDYLTESIELVASKQIPVPETPSQEPAAEVNNACIGNVCSCGDASIGDTRDPGKCSDCGGGWCNDRKCASCGSEKSTNPAPVTNRGSCVVNATECDCGNGNSKDPGKCDQCNGGWCKGNPASSKGGTCASCNP